MLGLAVVPGTHQFLEKQDTFTNILSTKLKINTLLLGSMNRKNISIPSIYQGVALLINGIVLILTDTNEKPATLCKKASANYFYLQSLRASIRSSTVV